MQLNDYNTYIYFFWMRGIFTMLKNKTKQKKHFLNLGVNIFIWEFLKKLNNYMFAFSFSIFDTLAKVFLLLIHLYEKKHITVQCYVFFFSKHVKLSF